MIVSREEVKRLLDIAIKDAKYLRHMKTHQKKPKKTLLTRAVDWFKTVLYEASRKRT